MKKIIPILVIMIVSIIGLVNFSCATSSNTYDKNEIISNQTKSTLVNLKNDELKSMEDYKEAYGSQTYGFVAYVLNKIRIYSIPLCFLGIVISAIYEYIIGIRNMESKDKGFNMMITFVTLLVICQVIPLVFAIIIKGWRN